MKILIYGFKQRGGNISEKIVKRLDKKFIKVILPIIYKKRYILSKIKKYRPDIIVGFGQTYQKTIAIERRAKNLYEIKKKRFKRKKIIDPKGSKQYLLNLKLKKILGTKISYNAGKHLCNFTMYIIMDYLKKQGLKTKFGFVHIPKDYEVQRALRIVKRLLSQIEGG